MSSTKTRRGRPRSFDPATALGPITDVFWDRGFDAASVDDLATAAGLNKPNLYGAFGDKRAMYRAALDGFRNTLTEAISSTLSGERALAEELRQFFETAISVYAAGDRSRGCLIMCTAPVASVTDSDVRAFLGAVIAQIDLAFTRRLEVAVSAGEAPRTAPTTLAPLLTALLQSLAIRARAGAPADDLRQIARDALDALVGGLAARRGTT